MIRSLVVASSLGHFQNQQIAAHPGVRELVELPANPWQVPDHADALFTGPAEWRKAPFDAPHGWPSGLKWIQIASAGVDSFPPWIFKVGLVTRGRDAQSIAVAEYVIGAVYAHEKRFWDGSVRSSPERMRRNPGSIAGKTIGIAGLGAIGQRVARTAQAIGMNVIALARSSRAFPAGIAAAAGLQELFASCDHLVVALPLTNETRASVNAECLAGARPGLHLINVARGALIDDVALLAALDGGRIAAATLDVTAPEPLPPGHPFYSHPLIRLTPHVSGMSEDVELRLSERLQANLDRYCNGEPVEGGVDPDLGY